MAEVDSLPTPGPAVIYVAEFELDAQSIESEPGLLPPRPEPFIRLPGIFSRLEGEPEDTRAVRAREL